MAHSGEMAAIPVAMESLGHACWPVCREGAAKGQQQVRAGHKSQPLLSKSVKMVVLPAQMKSVGTGRANKEGNAQWLSEDICSQVLFCFLQREDSKGVDKRERLREEGKAIGWKQKQS